MVIKCFTLDDDVVHVHQARGPLQSCKDRVHKTLKSGWRIAKAKRHDIESFECGESTFLSVVWVQLDLPVATDEVKSGEPLASRKGI